MEEIEKQNETNLDHIFKLVGDCNNYLDITEQNINCIGKKLDIQLFDDVKDVDCMMESNKIQQLRNEIMKLIGRIGYYNGKINDISEIL